MEGFSVVMTAGNKPNQLHFVDWTHPEHCKKIVLSSGSNGKVGRKATEREVYRVLLRVVNFSFFPCRNG